jgi:hypothetical protein
MKPITAALISALAFGGCASSKGDHTAASAEVTRAAPPASPTPAPDGKEASKGLVEQQGQSAETRKVIRTGHIELVVATYDDARAKLDALLKEIGGYVDSTQVDRRQTAVSDAVIVIRIPSEAFATVIPRLRQLGEVTSETTNAADITDQFVDTSARLASAEQLEKRLLELATARNGSIDQILAVERELARVRGEIEGYQGHLKQWNDQVALSTLTLTISTRRAEIAIAPTRPPSLGEQTSHAFHSSIAALREMGAWLVINGVAFLPWLLFLLPGGLVIRKIVRRYRRRLPTATALPPVTPTAPAVPQS